MARPPVEGGTGERAGGARVLPGCWHECVPLRLSPACGPASSVCSSRSETSGGAPESFQLRFLGSGTPGCERALPAVVWGSILAEFGLHGALRKKKNGVRRGSCSGVTGIFAFGDSFLFKHNVRFSVATCWLLLVWGVHRFSGSLSSFRVWQCRWEEVNGSRRGLG